MAEGEQPFGGQRAVVEAEARCVTVDAGAGTGKTTTMLMRIEHLLTSGVDPSDILVLTFANEAAASIRAAIADRLDPATAAAIDVFTYHSLCYRLVRDHAYYLGHSPQLEVVTEPQRRRIIERLLATEDYGFAQAGASAADIVEDVDRFVARMSRDDVDPDTLTDRLPDREPLDRLSDVARRIESRAVELFSLDREAVRYFNQVEHREAIGASLVEFGQYLTYWREELEESPGGPVVRDVGAYVGHLQDAVTRTRRAIDLDRPATKHLPRTLFANQIGGTTTATIEQTPVGRLHHYVSYLRLVRHYSAVYADYRETLRTEGAVDFDELVREATTLLSDEEVAEPIREEWAWICCDEFQDTDATQFDLLSALAGDEGGPSLLAIGDTDQAIYGWRGTDPAGLANLGKAFADHEAHSLEHNFRSPQAILDIANETNYGPQSSKRLHEAPLATERPPGARVLSVDMGQLELSTPETVARTVTRLLAGTVPDVTARAPGDIAVIVRTNRQAADIADALTAARLPHEVTGSPDVTLSPGMQTVVSLLRVLVDPGADRHLRRVLLVRYRIHRDDLERLHDRDQPLLAALQAIDPSNCREPDRIERARAHLAHLRSIQGAVPLSRLLEDVLETTAIDWFLEAAEREELEQVARFVEARQSESVLARLDEGFVDALERALSGSRSTIDRGDRSADSIDVMTVHQAKGLEFDTVLVPFLSDEHWCVDRDHAERSRHELLSATLDRSVESPLCADLATAGLREEWRVFHVAITRAANHLLLFGSNYEYDPPEALGVEQVDRCLPGAVTWTAAGTRLDLWTTLSAALDRVAERYPEAVGDLTATLADPDRPAEGTIIGPGGESISMGAAMEAVHGLGWLLRHDALLPAADAASIVGDRSAVPSDRHLESLTDDTVRFPVASITEGESERAAVRHSHSALATHERCPRRHYLDHVVQATADPAPTGGVDRRVVGSLFHDVAEESFYRGFTAPGQWHAVARRQCTARDLSDQTAAVQTCIDRYFDARATDIGDPVAQWEPLAAELPFRLEAVSGLDGPVVGYIDTIRRLPDGRLAVLDYKATAERIPPDEAGQLALYAEAVTRRYELTVDRVGYIYVGEAGPGADLYGTDEVPDWSTIRDRLETLETPNFMDYEAGAHCAHCPHASLGCAPPEHTPERWDFGDAD